MIQNVLRHLGGVENYGVLSLCLFFLIFAIMVVWAVLQGRSHVEHMARLPLETEQETQSTYRKDDSR